MSEITEKLGELLQDKPRPTFADWVESHPEDDQDAIREAINIAHQTRSYMPTYRVLRSLDHNPWLGSKDAMVKYANREFGD